MPLPYFREILTGSDYSFIQKKAAGKWQNQTSMSFQLMMRIPRKSIFPK